MDLLVRSGQFDLDSHADLEHLERQKHQHRPDLLLILRDQIGLDFLYFQESLQFQ